jgi:hypothetical protein
LSDLVKQIKLEKANSTSKTMVIMRRDVVDGKKVRDDRSPSPASSESSSHSGYDRLNTKILLEKEEAYHKARALIFSDSSGAENEEENAFDVHALEENRSSPTWELDPSEVDLYDRSKSILGQATSQHMTTHGGLSLVHEISQLSLLGAQLNDMQDYVDINYDQTFEVYPTNELEVYDLPPGTKVYFCDYICLI